MTEFFKKPIFQEQATDAKNAQLSELTDLMKDLSLSPFISA